MLAATKVGLCRDPPCLPLTPIFLPGYERKYAWVLVIFFTASLFFMNVSRLCHRLRPMLMFGKIAKRWHIVVAEVGARG